METDSEWMSISDMMSGLMLIFMFISISFMIEVKEDKEKIEKIARTYEKDKRELNEDLNLEFSFLYRAIVKIGTSITAAISIYPSHSGVMTGSKNRTVIDDRCPC